MISAEGVSGQETPEVETTSVNWGRQTQTLKRDPRKETKNRGITSLVARRGVTAIEGVDCEIEPPRPRTETGKGALL